MERDCEIVSGERGEPALRVHLEGNKLLRSPLLNKGTAFTEEERTAFCLHGLLPPAVFTLEQQVARAYRAFSELQAPIAKYAFLRALQDRQEIVFSALLEAHMTEMLPIVYTPTVGEAVQRYSAMYQGPRGLLLSTATIDRARALVNDYPADDVRMIVATDSSAILGIGDQGHGGVAIAIGKLALYTVGGGVSPFQSVPVGLDVGTEREDLRADPMYLGVRHPRLRGDDYFAFLDAFVDAVRARWPRAVIQWEDFAKDAAFAVLERYRDKPPSFNDDIQGTGAVALAGLLTACRLRGEALGDQRVVVHGAGAGGVGVATGDPERDDARGAHRRSGRGADLHHRLEGARHARPRRRGLQARLCAAVGARPRGARGERRRCSETIRGSRATVLLGLSGQPGSFDEASIRAMADNTDRPIIFPLSNPTSSVEATPEQILAWTRGRAIVATGSPFDPVIVRREARRDRTGEQRLHFPGPGSRRDPRRGARAHRRDGDRRGLRARRVHGGAASRQGLSARRRAAGGVRARRGDAS